MPLSFLGVLLIFPVNALVRATRNLCHCCWRCCCADSRRSRARVTFEDVAGRAPYQTLPDASGAGGSAFSPRGGLDGSGAASGLDDSALAGGDGPGGLNDGLTVLNGRDKVQLPTPPVRSVTGPTLHPTAGRAGSVASASRSAGGARSGGESSPHASSASSHGAPGGGRAGGSDGEGLGAAPGRRWGAAPASAAARYTGLDSDTGAPDRTGSGAGDGEMDRLLAAGGPGGGGRRGLVVTPIGMSADGAGGGGGRAPLV
jgi:hypothetical protein